MSSRKPRKTRADLAASIASDLRDVIFDLADLSEKVSSQRDNMSETNLVNTQKFQTIEAAADALEGILDELENQADELERMSFT